MADETTSSKALTGNQIMAALRNFPENAEVCIDGKPVTAVKDGGDGKVELSTEPVEAPAPAATGEATGEAATGEAAATAADKALADDDNKAPLTPEEQAALDETERLAGLDKGNRGKDPDDGATGDDSAGEGDAARTRGGRGRSSGR